MPSRRQLLATGIGASVTLFAGCLSEVPAQEHGDPGDDTDDRNGSDQADDDSENCDVPDLPLIDIPPHEPSRPSLPDDPDDWDAHYLGDGMDTDSPLDFSSFSVRYDPPILGPAEAETNHLISAELFTDRSEFVETIEPAGDDAEAAMSDIDFDTHAVVVVLSGLGSGSVSHEWVRLEEHCDTLHLHGYYRKPASQTDDLTVRTSAIVMERPEDDLDGVLVSLTQSLDERVNVWSDDGLVDLEGEQEIDNGADDLPGPLTDSTMISVTRQHAGDWWRDTDEGPGIAVEIPDADALESVVDMDDEAAQFIDETDFGDDAVYFIEVVGPTACYAEIELDELVLIANGEYILQGHVEIHDVSGDDEECAQVVSFSSVLLRVESDVQIEDARIAIIDGWGNEQRVSPQEMGDFAKE